jgi:hypothetical protein
MLGNRMIDNRFHRVALRTTIVGFRVSRRAPGCRPGATVAGSIELLDLSGHVVVVADAVAGVAALEDAGGWSGDDAARSRAARSGRSQA